MTDAPKGAAPPAAKEPPKETAAPVPPAAPFASDEEAAFALVQAVETAVEALQSIRAGLTDKRDATAATGHVLEALLMAGGSLREYDRSKIWALRHAIGGESYAFKDPSDALALILPTLAQGLRATSSADEERRKQTARVEIEAIAHRLTKCDHSIESTRAIDEWDRGMVSAKATVDKAAHEARLAASARPAPATPPKLVPQRPAPPAPRDPPGGDYALPGSVEAGADPFPTTKVG